MKTFIVKVEVDDDSTYEDIEQYLENNVIVNDVELVEVYEN